MTAVYSGSMVTSNDCLELTKPSKAVTVTVNDVPVKAATGLMVSVLPEIDKTTSLGVRAAGAAGVWIKLRSA